MSLRRLKALIVKEFLQIIRDPSSILISFVFPWILLFLYGFGVSLDMDHLRIGLVLEDTSPLAQRFAESLVNSRYFEVKTAWDRRELTDDLLKGNIRGIVVVPSYFSSFFERPNEIAPIQVIADASETNTAVFVQNYVQATWLNWLQQENISNKIRGQPLVTIQPRFWYNEELLSRNFLVPGSLALIMTLIGTLLTALVVAREWERGTMEAMMSTPVTIVEIVLGKLIPNYLLAMGSMTAIVLGAIFIFDVPFRGSYWVLALVTTAFLLTALGLGLLISTLSKNQFVASQAATVTAFLPAYILSGFIFEIASMPIIIQIVTYFVPARYFVSSLQTLFLAGDVWSLIISNMIPMLIMGILLFIVNSRFLAKSLE